MRNVILLLGILAVPIAVNAAMFKCTDANGRVSFSDQPCPDQQQETLKENTVSKPGATTAESEGDAGPAEGEASATEQAPGTAGAEKQEVTNDSPLAIAYMNFLKAMKQCDRGEMLKYGSGKIVTDLAQTSDADLQKQCELLQNLMPADFTGATQSIEGDKGTIEWRSESISTDEQGPTTLKSLYTVNFSRENGAWKYGD